MTQLKILMIGSIWPEQGASAASSRVLHVAQALLAQGWDVHFCADAKENGATEALRRGGIHCHRHLANHSAFDHFLEDLRPHVAIFDRFTTEEKFSWRVRRMLPDCIRVLDTIDLHFVRHGRTAAHAAGSEARTWSELLRFSGDIAYREVAAIYRSDLSLIVSDFEMDLLTRALGVPAPLLHLFRLTYPPPSFKVTPFAERHGFVVIGSFRHPPNVDSMLWLKEAIWPRVRRLKKDAHLEIYGAHATAQHLALTDPANGFHVVGHAADACGLMATKRVNLAPLRIGAGIKGKIADGWWSGTPVVTTAIGAEGMHEELPFGGSIAESAEDFAQAAVHLYDDQSLWAKASQASLTIIDRLYAEAVTTEPFLTRIHEILTTKDEHRLAHFTGQMLWQQGLRATEYFSRWIEAKNKQAST